MGLRIPSQGGFRPFPTSPFNQNGMLVWDGVTFSKPGVEVGIRVDMGATAASLPMYAPGTNNLYYGDTGVNQTYRFNPFDQSYEVFSNPTPARVASITFNPSNPDTLLFTFNTNDSNFYKFTLGGQSFSTQALGVSYSTFRGSCYIPAIGATPAQIAFCVVESGVGKVVFVNATTYAVIGVYSSGLAHFTENIAYCPTNNYVYITLGETGAAQPILVVDPTTRTLVTSISNASLTQGRRIIYCPYNNRLYATYGLTTTPRIVVINPETQTIDTLITPSGTGVGLLGIAYNPSNNRIYVPETDNASTKRVHIINPAVSPAAIESSVDVSGASLIDICYHPITQLMYIGLTSGVSTLS